MGWRPDHRPIREKYSPKQSAAEKRHEAHVQAQPCFGCGRSGSSAHHTLLKFSEKRWRRDHHWRFPVCWDCHQGPEGIHGIGNEEKWLLTVERSRSEAIELMRQLWLESEAEYV